MDSTTIPESVLQQTDLAINYHGYAMRDGATNRGLNEVINAYAKSATTVAQQIEVCRKNKLPKDDIFRYWVEPSPQELGPQEPGLHKYMIVGYAPRVQTEDYQTISNRQENSKDDQTPNTLPKVIEWDEDEPPLFVVTEILRFGQNTHTLRMYALITPVNGLCVPQSIHSKYVFFRHEFRNSANYASTRSLQWPRLVRIAVDNANTFPRFPKAIGESSSYKPPGRSSGRPAKHIEKEEENTTKKTPTKQLGKASSFAQIGSSNKVERGREHRSLSPTESCDRNYSTSTEDWRREFYSSELSPTQPTKKGDKSQIPRNKRKEWFWEYHTDSENERPRTAGRRFDMKQYTKNDDDPEKAIEIGLVEKANQAASKNPFDRS